MALQPIATDFGAQRAGPALAVTLTYVGAGLDGIGGIWSHRGDTSPARFGLCSLQLGIDRYGWR